ncbi:Protein phosphatase 1, regulatory subunit [Phytophthora cinnamomi]|uniref:Protein phosphatase 1, regulatory subunit n=1 Tax=Phytophthora cinnamomi TaxID=4785 RepID=UPI00355AC861|nr:Protein phosphatase 1, regulatory subunit [Phytophthora cinnamomi]
MDSFDLSEQRIVQLEQIPPEIRRQVETGDGVEYALDLSLNRLRGIDQIGIFEHVSQLDLSGNQLENVNGIQALRRLQSLDLSRNCIATVDLLALLPALQVLKVAENSLTSVDALQLLPELRVVDASYNRISKWPPLAGLSLLETLDMSDNMLGAFSSSVSATLFPSRLRRLSIARNQIDQLCGIACLGLQLPILEFFAFDGNPIVLEIARSGGQLERLIAMFFSSLPLSNDGGLTMTGRRHEEFATPSHTVNELKRAILEGREEALDEFLVTGSMTGQVDLMGIGGVLMPPPPPVERPLPNRPLTDTIGDQSAIDNALSHDSKMEIWKRIQEDRKAQFSQSNISAFASSAVKRDKSVRWEQHIEQSVPPLQDDVRKPALTTADLAVPESSPQAMPALDASSLSVMKPLETMTFPSSINPMKGSQPQSSPDSDALVKKVKTLTEQVLTMRKYMKVRLEFSTFFIAYKITMRLCSDAGVGQA